MANGMKKVKEYPDPKNKISYAFAITREEWLHIDEQFDPKVADVMIDLIKNDKLNND